MIAACRKIGRVYRASAINRRGLTLAELLVSIAILGMMSVVLAGMSFAVQSAWDYTKDVEDSGLQADAAVERIRYMLSQTGTYRISGQPTRIGARIVTRTVGSTPIPDVLVLWTGGRNGGLASQGTRQRLPTAGELLVYRARGSDPRQVVEVSFPGNTADVDFAAADFDSTIDALLALPSAEAIPLCERLRVSSLSDAGSGAELGGSINAASVGCVRFQLVCAPADAELSTAIPNTPQWLALGWPQGAVSGTSGVRQCTLNLELQAEPRDGVQTTADVTAIPYFHSASVRYVYEP